MKKESQKAIALCLCLAILKMRIKKVNRNEYLYSNGIWVRNFTKDKVKSTSINSMYSTDDFPIIVDNEMENSFSERISFISDEKLSFPNIVIISDGFDFINKQQILSKLPKNVAILAVNGALKKWSIYEKRSINFYVINNPYKESQNYLPKRYFPTCIASTRTNKEFLSNYLGNKYLYVPTPEESLASYFSSSAIWHVDDYRNPICAAIGLAYKFGVEKLLLFCCDDSFSGERPSAEELPNGLWQYPQHNISQSVIDSNLYWLKNQKNKNLKIGNHSSGRDYNNASYIEADEILNFFVG